jgi:DNA (cytosine-5)-methyltransferase 1
MTKKNSFITVTDQFCGAGGSSQGVHNLSNKIGGGLEVKLALNHWKLAIETHNTNFPNTQHECTDISACDPRRYPSTDILITSPECTNHSLAKGKKVVKKQMDLFTSGKADAAAERSRSTMWDVCRFAEYHQYNIIIVENVVDAKKWVMFDAWLNAMYVLGYQHKCVYLNSQHMHPTPQSRDRMYIVFWKKGNKAPMLDYTPVAHCPQCEKDVQAIQTWKNPEKKFGKYKQQYLYRCPIHGIVVEPYYYAAFNCIDWSDIGTKIGERKKALSPNTTSRINYGLKKYGTSPFQIQTVHGEAYKQRTKSIVEPSFTHTTFQSQAFIVNDQHSTGIDCRVNGIGEKLPTIATAHHFKLVTPFVLKCEHSHNLDQSRKVGEPFQTQVTRQSMALVTPWIVEMNKTGECKPASNSTATITAGGINHAMLASPFIVENKGQSTTKPITNAAPCLTTKPHLGIITNEAFNSFIQYNRQQNPTAINEAVQTVATVEQLSIINYQQTKIEDCYYRMLKPKEIKLAMAFAHDYIILGSGKDQVKQCGNAVTPPAMEWLIKQCVDSLK